MERVTGSFRHSTFSFTSLAVVFSFFLQQFIRAEQKGLTKGINADSTVCKKV